MNERRCAWCGKKLNDAAHDRSFCSKPCQHQFENWCRSRAIARTEAVHRWRNSGVVARSEGMVAASIGRSNTSGATAEPAVDR